jgi:hypothetical protein
MNVHVEVRTWDMAGKLPSAAMPSSSFALLLMLVAGAVAPASAANVPGEPLTGSGDVTRTLLPATQLEAGDLPTPVDNSAFALPENAAPPRHEMRGTLQLFGGGPSSWTVHHDFYSRALEPPIVAALRRIPRLDIALTQSGSHLIPTHRGLRFTGDAYWNAIVGAGRIWAELGDGGASRASLPVTLVERNQNCAYHGVVSFLFDGATTSPAAFQVTQETCKYFKFDLWDAGPTRFAAGDVPDAEAIAAAYAAEAEARLPVRPIEAVQADYPRSQVYPQSFGAGMDRDHLTAFGVFFDGTHYAGPVRTRHGAYPYPHQIRLPSYSTAKTAFAAVALMRLAQKYDEDVAQLLLRDYLPKPPKDAWKDVTFEHALDMATGHYWDPADQEDERDTTTELNFFVVENQNRKLRGALAYTAKEAPGRRWVYHTTDTYLLTYAMTEYLGRHVGATKKKPADLLAFVADEVYRPLGLSAGALQAVRTENRADGRPFGGYGMFWTPDDILKIANLLNLQGGRIGDRQVLQPDLLASAMQENPDDRGVDAVHQTKPNKYNNSVWSRQIQVPDGATGTRDIWVRQMLGYGGIGVLMLPNGAVFYYFGDADDHEWLRSAREAYKLK